jgi:hypothetical protein
MLYDSALNKNIIIITKTKKSQHSEKNTFFKTQNHKNNKKVDNIVVLKDYKAV